MSTTCRPRSYRRSGDFWQPALVALCSRGWHSDAEVAEYLSLLGPDEVAALVAGGDWRQKTVEAHLARDEDGKPVDLGGHWTARMVKYYRQQLGIPGLPASARKPTEERDAAHSLHQNHRGWGYLRPYYDRDAHQWLPGHELKPKEVDILCLLRDRGSLTRREIAEALEAPTLHTGPQSYLGRLQKAGLIISTASLPRLYALLAPPDSRVRRPTGIEAAFARLLGVG